MPDPKHHERKPPKTRSDQHGNNIKLPEVDHGYHLIEWLHDVGPYEQGTNGPMALTWQEINAWKQATGVAVTAEELGIIRHLSKCYVSQLNASANPAEPSPMRIEGADKAQLAKDLKAAIRNSVKRDQ